MSRYSRQTRRSRFQPFGQRVLPRWSRTTALAVLCLSLPAGAGAKAPPGPLLKGQQALATVNGSPLTVDEFFSQLAEVHQEGATPSGKSLPKERPWDLLERMINIRLVLLEARNIGLDDLPEVKQLVDAHRHDSLRSVLYQRRAQALTKPDQDHVEKLYREAVKEVRVRSLLLTSEAEAADVRARLENGGDFAALAKTMVAQGKAKEDDPKAFLKLAALMPEIRAALAPLTIGALSPLVPLPGGIAIMRLEDIRFPDDPEARQKAENMALEEARRIDLKRYTDELRGKYAKINQKLLDSLNYEAAAPGFETLLHDSRPVAEIRGEPPMRVSELSESIRTKYFHGVERAIAEKKINARKSEALNEILLKRVVEKEALRLGIDRSSTYKRLTRDYEDGVAFGMFVQKVIDPTLKLDEAALHRYMEEHRSEYTAPAMIRLDGIAFRDKPKAEEALVKLQKGADFAWMRTNAEGQASASPAESLPLDGNLVVTASLPADVQRAVAGARAGDPRVYQEVGGLAYVLRVRDLIPPVVQEFDAVKDALAGKVREQGRQEAMRDWSTKLRKAYTVTMHVSREDLERTLGVGPLPASASQPSGKQTDSGKTAPPAAP